VLCRNDRCRPLVKAAILILPLVCFVFLDAGARIPPIFLWIDAQDMPIVVVRCVNTRRPRDDLREGEEEEDDEGQGLGQGLGQVAAMPCAPGGPGQPVQAQVIATQATSTDMVTTCRRR